MGRSAVLTLTRQYHFCAAHRMWNDAFSEEKNRRLYGKCANDDGHGHNYLLEVTVGGAPDPQSGLLAVRTELDDAVAPLLERLDHHNINGPLHAAGYPVSTSEALAAACWDWLRPVLGERLAGIRIVETERNSFEYFGPRAP
jgi:6-pyruvoyltetrahydropterin/6-carboxytetrahydropterin synthase